MPVKYGTTSDGPYPPVLELHGASHETSRWMVVWSVFSWRGITNNMERGMQVPGRHSSKFGLLVHRHRRGGKSIWWSYEALTRNVGEELQLLYFTVQTRTSFTEYFKREEDLSRLIN